MPGRTSAPGGGISAWSVGTDIISVARVQSLVSTPGPLRWFTPAEREHCASKAHPARHLAGRLAAKEAVYKALGLPGDGPVPWSRIEVVAAPGAAPVVLLHGDLDELVREAGVALRLSISHCEEYATAVAMTVPA